MRVRRSSNSHEKSFMKINVGRALTIAWHMWRGDWDLLVRVAGLFVFLPQFASLLLVPVAPPMPEGASDEAAVRGWIEAFSGWFGLYGPWLFAAELLTLFGSVVLLTLYLGNGRPPVRDALRDSLRLFPRYFLAALLVSLPAGLFMLPAIGTVLVLPSLYVLGRLLLSGAVIVAEPPVGVIPALRRSVRLTRGNGLVMMAISGLLLFGGQLAALPFVMAGRALGGAPMANPVTAALLDAMAAAALSVTVIVAVLVRIALYREALALNREL